MKNARRRCAFTLLEVLLALAMISMLALALYSSLAVAIHARASTTAAVAPARAAQIAVDLVEQDLENALPPTGTFAGPFVGQPSVNDGAQNDTLQFYCLQQGTRDQSFDPISFGGICRVELGMQGSPDGLGSVLVRRLTRNLVSPQVADAEEEILGVNVRSFGLRYYDGVSWVDTWDSTQQGNVLPAVIEITLELLLPGRGGEPPVPYRVTRLVLPPCHRDSDLTGGPF